MDLEEILIKQDSIAIKLKMNFQRAVENELLRRRIFEAKWDSLYGKNNEDYKFSKISEWDLFHLVETEVDRLINEKKHLVAFQGEHGAYSEIAAKQAIPGSVYIPCTEFEYVFDGVMEGIFDYGIIPIENSLGGPVVVVNDLLLRADLYVVGEISVMIKHCLLVPMGVSEKDVRIAYSHPQALAQCRQFLRKKNIKAMPYYDTAGAAKMVAEDPSAGKAAIGSVLCSEIYGLNIAFQHIADNEENFTRFFLIAGNPVLEKGKKTTIIFTTPHEAGMLLNVLKEFARESINLTRIASIPSRDKAGYYDFVVDLEGSLIYDEVKRTLEKLGSLTTFLKVLGSYPVYPKVTDDKG